jgi:YfiH family protein
LRRWCAVRPITFLSDYGLGDEFVGVVHGVIATICPDTRVIDLGHGVPRQDVQAGALMLARALPYVPAGVHLAVVDPEVGARRRAVALRAGERLLVGPDNGLLIDAAERFGGVAEAVEISASPWRLEPVSATFHGRDVFAPVAARLACEEPLADAGAPLDPAELVRLERTEPRLEADALVAHGGAVGVRTADCVPILIADPQRGRVAAVHSGWRGTAQRIAARAVEALAAQGSNPAWLVAAIGPAIQACCYEVSDELGARFAAAFGEDVVSRARPRPHLDLPRAVRKALEQSGVAADRIEVLPHCTSCDSGRFFSHRRDRGRTGRHLSFVACAF